MDRMENEFDALLAEYRDACGQPEGSPEFMPKLWARIEARRSGNASVFRTWVQVCVVAAIALTLLMAIVIPRIQRMPVYNASYEDVLADEHASHYTQVLAGEDFR